VLADRFFDADLRSASAFAIVPSRGALLRELLVERDGDSGLKVTSPGLPDVRMEFDSSGLLSRAEGGGLLIERGKPGGMSSRPFMPVGGARAVKEVRVPAPEKLKGGEHLELAGSLYVPAGKAPHPAVVLAGDFGPQDRTGNGFLAQVARRLVDDGFAVLTCDRRGIPQSQGDYATYTRETAERDLNAQVDFLVLRGDIGIDSISLVGYGEGGQLASSVAASNPYVKAVVLMATPSVPLFPDLTAYQLQAAESSGLVEPAEITAERLRLGTEVSTLNETSGDTVELEGQELFLGWMRSQAFSDPLASVRALEVPALVVQGGRDVVVAPEHADAIMRALQERGSGTQELALFDELGHEFGLVLSEAASIPYRAHPEMDEKVLKKVSSWLKALAP
jgi:pimeloyl-ACP methyl ester carboxylesterase